MDKLKELFEMTEEDMEQKLDEIGFELYKPFKKERKKIETFLKSFGLEDDDFYLEKRYNSFWENQELLIKVYDPYTLEEDFEYNWSICY